MIARFLAFTALIAAPAAAYAQDTKALPPWTLQQAIGDPADFRLSGSIRGRYETIDNQFRPGVDKSDGDFMIRTTYSSSPSTRFEFLRIVS